MDLQDNEFIADPFYKPSLEDLVHYGVKRRSGRYPWGSGENPFQHSGDFLARVESLQKQGLTENEICKSLNMSSTDYRMQVRRAKAERKQLQYDKAKSMRDDGKTLQEIADELGLAGESSVRNILSQGEKINKDRAKETAEILKKELETKGIIDVGKGVSNELGVSEGTLKEALFILETEGYVHTGIGHKQVTNDKQQTNMEVIAKTDLTEKELQASLYKDPDQIQTLGEYHSVDGGTTYEKLAYPASLDSDRIAIRYGDEGGSAKDGVIEIRPGVDDLSLGDSHYAQVRILVDGDHYMKGMAIYSDDLPDGVDVVFNTNKNSSTAKMDVLKKAKDDPDNPFGATIKAGGQTWIENADGTKTLSVVNKLKEEGDYDTMSRNLSSQFLSKQNVSFIKQQLSSTYQESVADYDEIMSLTNNTIKRKMLIDFADECDGAAVQLQAAALPRQSMQVILPLTKISDTEVYAPNYRDGEKVALVRYPHAGTFEIPVLTVNNKNSQGKSTLGNVKDAIGINSKVAEQLSGADFDGDTVVVIPLSSKVKIKTSKPLKELEGFDPKTAYPETKGMTYLSKDNQQREMGIVSNLITDMTLKNADTSEIARAVKHSMVVIDAEKHKLNYKQSEKDQGIAELKKKYQGYTDSEGDEHGGASTLISRRKQTVQVPETKGSRRIDPDTGEYVYKESGREYTNKQGKTVKATTKRSLILETDDVRTLSSGTEQENAYADYANKMKALANTARKQYLATPRATYSKSAEKTYASEVASLNSKLNTALKNAPKERRAQVVAASKVKAKVQANPELATKAGKKQLKKVKQQALTAARADVGASSKSVRISITDGEWDAIQAGAISDTKLSQMLKYCDTDNLKQRSMPKSTGALSTAKQAKIKAMAMRGCTRAEIADALGVSTSTVSKYI